MNRRRWKRAALLFAVTTGLLGGLALWSDRASAGLSYREAEPYEVSARALILLAVGSGSAAIISFVLSLPDRQPGGPARAPLDATWQCTRCKGRCYSVAKTSTAGWMLFAAGLLLAPVCIGLVLIFAGLSMKTRTAVCGNCGMVVAQLA